VVDGAVTAAIENMLLAGKRSAVKEVVAIEVSATVICGLPWA